MDFQISDTITAHVTDDVFDLHAIVYESPEKVAVKYSQTWSRIDCFAKLDMCKVSHMLCCSPSVSPVHAHQ